MSAASRAVYVDRKGNVTTHGGLKTAMPRAANQGRVACDATVQHALRAFTSCRSARVGRKLKSADD
jgi:hypothetical protein